MIADDQANTVFISDLLGARFPSLVEGLGSILADHAVPLRIIGGTRDIWTRDFMPVQVGPDAFVRFRYTPDYLRGFEHLITAPENIEPIPPIGRCEDSEIVLDGGNVVRQGGRCILTDKVFRENPSLPRDELIGKLGELLRIDDLIVIPVEPGDEVGHADGVVRFLDEGTVVINDYEEIAPWYGKRLKSALRRAGLEWVELPYCPVEGRRGEIAPASGNYVNYLRVGGLLVLPGFGLPEDDRARRILSGLLPGTEVVTLGCSDLSMEGGVLNCATWTIVSRTRSPEGRFPASSPFTLNHQNKVN